MHIDKIGTSSSKNKKKLNRNYTRIILLLIFHINISKIYTYLALYSDVYFDSILNSERSKKYIDLTMTCVFRKGRLH